METISTRATWKVGQVIINPYTKYIYMDGRWRFCKVFEYGDEWFQTFSLVVRIVSLLYFFLDEIGEWRQGGVLFNSARGPNSTNHSALGPAIMACLRGLTENIIKVVQHTFLLTVKKYIYI